MEENSKKIFIINVFFVGVWLALIYVTGKFLLKFLLPFIFAVCIAAAVQRPAELISQRIKLKKGVCAALISAVIYSAAASVVILALVKILSEVGTLLSLTGTLGKEITHIISDTEQILFDFTQKISTDSNERIKEIIVDILLNFAEKISDFISDFAAKTIKGAPSFLFSILVSLAATCYIAKDFDGLCKFLEKLLSEKTVKTIVKLKDIFKVCILKILGGYMILMLITFIESFIGLLFLRVENAVTIAVLIAFVDILPVLGAGTILIPWAIISILSGNVVSGIGFVALYIFITIVRNFTEPKIVGNKLGINPLFVLITMFLGLRLFGVFGMLILPVTFIVMIKYYKNEMEQETS